ncbi:beta-glucuronosyltransferase GlcAT14A-like [Triticum urartu]|uniref:Xylosyltransferase 1 n=1 Tax=Triticum urartu TaxID=4572 RepID=A0A8R7TXT0_TRIUA|nr:beta-glucuronosyltransferase GlcAT14A-like [Triticum urartu]
MPRASWLLACSPCAGLASLAALTTGLLVLGYASSSFLRDAAYGYDDPYSPDAADAASTAPPATVPRRGAGYPPVLAYYISGGHGDSVRMTRLLKAVYHPRNRYLLHLDAGAGAYERARLAGYVRSEQPFLEYGNVHVVGKGSPVDGRGASAVAAVLRGASVLMRIGADWDWLVTLAASDYPLVSQDDLLYAFSTVPRDLNFIDHRMDSETAPMVVLDQNLLQNTNAEISFSSGHRPKPDAFELFKGSPWTILSRAFVKHCVVAPDNLPRTLLMYFSNALNPMEFYFQTVMANSAHFKNSAVNHTFRIAVPDAAPPHRSRYDAVVSSGAAFAGRFGDDGDEALLQRIDEELLRRPLDGVTPGQWCAGSDEQAAGEECSVGGDIDVVRQGEAGQRLASLMAGLVGAGP